MKITVLDAKTLGDDLSLDRLNTLGQCEIFDLTAPEEVAQRINDTDVVIINKIKLNKSNLENAKKLKLICVAATGYDNIDIEYCKSKKIAVCNVVGYSTHSVAQVTLAQVLSLSTNLLAFNDHVKSGKYTSGGVANKLTPVYHELYNKTWGIIGFGNIGKQVGKVASALGCNLLVHKRSKIDGFNCVDIDTLCKNSDIISIHTPLSDKTLHLINEKRLAMMKKDVILVNTSRGAVTDEEAVAKAIKDKKIGGFATDVYAQEPFLQDHPFNEIKDYPNVLLTPHMAWGAYEARVRCLDTIIDNIKAFYNGQKQNRVDLL